jgi:hypothetical protein
LPRFATFEMSDLPRTHQRASCHGAVGRFPSAMTKDHGSPPLWRAWLLWSRIWDGKKGANPLAMKPGIYIYIINYNIQYLQYHTIIVYHTWIWICVVVHCQIWHYWNIDDCITSAIQRDISCYIIWLVVSTPLKNMSQNGSSSQLLGKISHVPNHQPVMFEINKMTYWLNWR